MNAITELLEAEAAARAAEQRDRDFEHRQAARRRRVAGLAPGVIVADPRDWPRGHTAGLAGLPATPPADAAEPEIWLEGHAEGARLAAVLTLPGFSRMKKSGAILHENAT